MQLPVYFISDNHFMLETNSSEKKRREKLFNLFENISKTGGTLIIGGDFFDFWLQSFIGVPKYYNDLLEALKNLSKQNIVIHYVLGNHDYWDFGILNKKYKCIIHKGDLSLKIDDISIFITHGDGLLKNDKMYRFMKKIIRSKVFVLMVRLIPISIMTMIARKITDTKKKFDKNYIGINKQQKEELENFAFEKMNNDNLDVLLMGHYHQTGIIDDDDKKFIHLGDWINQFTVTILDESKNWSQKRW